MELWVEFGGWSFDGIRLAGIGFGQEECCRSMNDELMGFHRGFCKIFVSVEDVVVEGC